MWRFPSNSACGAAWERHSEFECITPCGWPMVMIYFSFPPVSMIDIQNEKIGFGDYTLVPSIPSVL